MPVINRSDRMFQSDVFSFGCLACGDRFIYLDGNQNEIWLKADTTIFFGKFQLFAVSLSTGKLKEFDLDMLVRKVGA